MKKIWICYQAKADELSFIKNEIKPLKIFASRKLAENYCHWKNQDFDPMQSEWIWYRSYYIDEIDYSKIPF